MNRAPFTLTRYIWPIHTQIVISEKMDYRLCNPDSEDVDVLAAYLKAAYERDRITGSVDKSIFFEQMIREYIRKSPETMREIEFKGDVDDFWHFIASNWIVIKTDNWLPPRDEYDDSYTFDILSSYFSILDFYRGVFATWRVNSLLLNPFYPQNNTANLLEPLFSSLMSVIFGMGYHAGDRVEDDGTHHIYIPKLAIEDIIKTAKIVNNSEFMDKPLRNMHFFGELLSSCFIDTKNYYMKALTMCSIIEYIVARNPDSGKFNVDESINKQFQMKTSLLAHKYDESIDLGATAKFLKLAYDLRSSIAHGSFDDVDKILSKYGEEIYEFDHQLHEITLKCFRAYLQYPELAKFIKRS